MSELTNFIRQAMSRFNSRNKKKQSDGAAIKDISLHFEFGLVGGSSILSC